MFLARWSFIIMVPFLIAFAPIVSASAQECVLFEDRFDGQLKPGWRWLRENPNCRRFAENALEIIAEPFADSEAKNVLLRPADFRGKGKFQVETKLTFLDKPTCQFQQGGLYWMQNGRVVFKLVHEYVDGRLYIFPGKIPVDSPSVNLRLISNGDDIIAEYCGDGEATYRRIYEGKLEKGNDDEIGIQCWNGSNANPCRILFHHFRIVRLDD